MDINPSYAAILWKVDMEHVYVCERETRIRLFVCFFKVKEHMMKVHWKSLVGDPF